LKCVWQPQIAKKSLKTLGSPGKLVSSACYDKQQVCVYLQLFSC